MKPVVAAVLLVGVSVGTAKTEPPPSDYSAQREACRARAALEKDARLATLSNSPPQKVGIFHYYPNKGGGYTFIQGKDIVFYALPYTPSTYECRVRVRQRVTLVRPGGLKPINGGIAAMVNVTQSINVPTIGPSKVPFGGQTIYRTEMFDNGKDGLYRKDIRLAYWSREQADGNFLLWILADDRETQMKLKSIVPVLEHSGHVR